MNPKYDPLESIGRDPDALEAFDRDHVDAVQAFVARRVWDPGAAADLTADIFVAAIDSAHRYEARRGPVLAWLYGVGRNVVAAELRRSSRELRTARRIEGRRLLGESGLTRIEEQIDAASYARRVYEAIGRLPERDRRLLELVAVDGLSVAEAAGALGVTSGTARVRLHRSRTRLAALLREPESPGKEIAVRHPLEVIS
jgi:RNA polymerase sigma-70 factor (ECF subfamily)